MKKFLLFAIIFMIVPVMSFAEPSKELIVHNIQRVTNGMENFKDVGTDLDDRDTVVDLSIKIGKLKEAINSGQEMKDGLTGRGFVTYYKALGQFESGLNDFERAVRTKDKVHIKKAVEHFNKGEDLMLQLTEGVKL